MKNYVYHGTPLLNLNNILKYNALLALSEIDYYGKTVKGISTTRSYLYCSNLWRNCKLKDENNKNWVVLTLDLDKIKQDHKVLPIDFDVWHYNKFYKKQFEEFIFGRLYPLTKYLISIERIL